MTLAAQRTTETLDASPTLGVLYGRALLTARSGGDTLPGRRLELPNVRIDPAALADYARVCGFAVGGDVPVTYPHMLAFPLQMRLMTDPDFPLPAPGMVHLRNTITQHRPLAADEAVTVTVHAERLAAHPKGTQVDLVTSVTDVPASDGGSELWGSRSTYFVRGARAPEGAAPADEGVPPEPDPQVGTRPHGVWSVPGDIGRRYVAVSGDVNPIHMNSLAAKAFGMPGIIAHGMWSKARVVAALAGRHAPAVTVDVVFRKPLTVPSRPQLFTAQAPGGWDVALRSSKGRDHLLATLRDV